MSRGRDAMDWAFGWSVVLFAIIPVVLISGIWYARQRRRMR